MKCWTEWIVIGTGRKLSIYMSGIRFLLSFRNSLEIKFYLFQSIILNNKGVNLANSPGVLR